MKRFFLLALLAMVCACHPGAVRDAQKKKDAELPTPRSLAELKARVTAILAEEHVPGASIALVTRDGVEWTGGFGKADVARGTDVTADTLFRAASITKSFVALAVVRLAEQKKLDLSAKVRDLAPEIAFENAWEATHPITVAHLLEHTAGWDDTRPPEYVATREDMPLRDVLAVDPRTRVSRWAPGTRYSYSNPGYTLAAYLIEKVTGRAYEDYIAETLFRPLGMTSADLRHTPAVDARIAQGYVDDVPTPVAYIPIMHRPAGNLHASAADLAHLVEMWIGRSSIDGEELFSREAIAAMQTSRTLPPSPLGVGYGFANATELVEGRVAHGHDGGLDGFSTEAMYIPEIGVGWVYLMNTSAPGLARDRLRSVIVRYLARDADAPVLPTGAALSTDALSACAGYYTPASPRNENQHGFEDLLRGRTVFVKDGELWERSFLTRPTRLVPTGVPGGFRGERDGTTRVLFTRRDIGDVMLWELRTMVKTSPWKIRALRGVVFSSFAMMASSILFALVWIPRWLFGKRFRLRARPMATRVAPLVASVLGFACLGVFASMSGIRHFVPLVNARTVGAFVVTILFLVASGAALGYALRSIVRRHEVRVGVKVHSLVVALASCAIVLWMAYWRWIGVRLWDW